MSNFFNDLNRAKKYEELFQDLYNDSTYIGEVKWNDMKYFPDYIINIKDNHFFGEIKIDFTHYDSFFIERYSNVKSKRLGGPWGALKYGAHYFIYWFISEKNQHQWECFIFRTHELVQWLYDNENNYKMRYVGNDEYVTCGYSIPISHLENMNFTKKRTLAPDCQEKGAGNKRG